LSAFAFFEESDFEFSEIGHLINVQKRVVQISFWKKRAFLTALHYAAGEKK